MEGLTTFFNKTQALVPQNQGQKAEKNLNVLLSNKLHWTGSQHIISLGEETTQQERADVENSSHRIPRAQHPFPHHSWMESCCRDVRSVLGSSKMRVLGWQGASSCSCSLSESLPRWLPWRAQPRAPESSSSTQRTSCFLLLQQHNPDYTLSPRC